jgi:DMSO/TMAO reductase YedYZ molybdopterin-dependent catalytic subunit
MEPIISRGFKGRRADGAPTDRVPPGQYVTDDYPVLSAGPTPHMPLDRWDFSIVGDVEEPRRWTWEEFRALPSEPVTADIHCVTKWSKLETRPSRIVSIFPG